jgi:hypothetical protein
MLGVSVLLAACAGSQDSAEDKAETLAVTWSLAKAGGLAYVAICTAQPQASICSPAVVDGTVKALQVGDVAVAEARSAIVAAGSDASARAKALAIGLSAIAVFQQTMMTYGVRSG